MTNHEAIDELQYAIDLIKQDGKDWIDERDIPILEMAISALQAQDVPDTNDGDMVSRQRVIDELKRYFHDEYYQRTSIQDCIDCFIEDIIIKLPSAQPEPTRTFVELVVRYPDPELCAYKEYKGKPYYSIKYIENGETHVGYGTYNPEVLSQYLKEYFISSAQPEETCGSCLYRGLGWHEEPCDSCTVGGNSSHYKPSIEKENR